MHSSQLAIVLLATVAFTHVSGLLTDSACPEGVKVKQNFSLKDYVGRWYEIKRYEQFYEKDLDCVVAEYQPREEGGITVANGAFSLANNTRVVGQGVGIISYPEAKDGKLSVAFFGAKPDRSNYWVLDTDYTSYAVVWSCEPYYKDASKNVLGFWIFSRQPTFPTDETTRFTVEELVKQYGDESKFEITNQSDERCPRSYV